MKEFKILLISTLLLITGCGSDNQNLSAKEEAEIQNELKEITTSSLKSWEPPFSDETFLDEFYQSENLLIVIDDFVMTGYANWKNAVISSLKEEREQGYKMYKHIVDDVYISALSKTSAVSTVFYTWDYITKDDLHYNVKARATTAYKKVDGKWKGVQFIVSHGEQKLIK